MSDADESVVRLPRCTEVLERDIGRCADRGVALDEVSTGGIDERGLAARPSAGLFADEGPLAISANWAEVEDRETR